jgi:hypothetical protein
MTMQPLRAHVRNGRLVLDEPTDLPEGEVVYLQPVDDARRRLGRGRAPSLASRSRRGHRRRACR